tara:strand:+ start:963 stop:1184 length:222 start_codon:yes stop_codon:yes gene_type:complete
MKPKSKNKKKKNIAGKLMGGRGGAKPTGKMGATKKPKKSGAKKGGMMGGLTKKQKTLPLELQKKIKQKKYRMA